MKKNLIICGLVMALTAGWLCAFAAVRGENVHASGNIVSKSMTIGSFETIDASRAVKVVVVERPQGDVLIEADDNLIGYVVVTVDDDKELKVGVDKELKNISRGSITVTVPANSAIRSFEASSAARIISTVPLTAPEVSLDASSAARIEAVVHSETCKIEASSAARIAADVITKSCRVEASSAAGIEIKGKAMTCNVDMSSASKLAAPEFVVGEYSIDVSSAANASVNCLATLNANASSGAKISYTGSCGGNRHASSGGHISKN